MRFQSDFKKIRGWSGVESVAFSFRKTFFQGSASRYRSDVLHKAQGFTDDDPRFMPLAEANFML
jgi:hypothetical protein